MTRTYRSFAKINLHLQVDGKLGEGYHRLRTVFQTVELHDLVTVERRAAPGVELAVPDGGAPADASNLAHRAAAAVLERWAPDAGLAIILRKRIPAGGGLGGGSSNAATVLVGACEVLGLDPPAAELRALARSLGADVPYFLVGGTALGLGRGDEIVPLPEMEEEEVVLATPRVEVSTAEIFRALDAGEGGAATGGAAPRPLPAALLDFVQGGPCPGIAGLGGFNELEATVLERVPAVRSVYNALRRAGADCVRLSGSGATVFACFARAAQGDEIGSHLPDDAMVYVTRTLSRSATLRARAVALGEGDRR
jgi:4-diphosphocytidyl-2-C-methyl-D-erythritol kinase